MRGNRTMSALSLLLVLTGCGAGTDEPEGSGGRTKDNGETSSRPSDSEKSGDVAPEPIMLGTQRYVSPCRLLPPEELSRVYGNPGKYATFTQETVEKSLSPAEMREVSRTIGGSVRTVCSYSFDNRAQTSVDVEVQQHASPRAARQRWKRIKRLGTGIESRRLAGQPGAEWLAELARENEGSQGGVSVKGLDPSILFVAGRINFVGVRRNLLITVERKNFDGNPFAPARVKGDLRTTRVAFRRIYRHADDQSLDQSPLPPWWHQEKGWPAFLDACAVFDDEAMVAAAGHGAAEPRTRSVVRDPDTRVARNDKPAWRAVHNNCERMATVERAAGNEHWSGELELHYAAPGDTGTEVLDGFVVRKLVNDKMEDEYRLSDLVTAGVLRSTTVQGADSAYVFDYRKSGMRYGWIVGNVGPYVFLLDVSKSKRRGFGSVPMSAERLVAGAERVVANIATQTESAG